MQRHYQSRFPLDLRNREIHNTRGSAFLVRGSIERGAGCRDEKASPTTLPMFTRNRKKSVRVSMSVGLLESFILD